MNFELPTDTADLVREIGRWARSGPTQNALLLDEHLRHDRWADFLKWGLLDPPAIAEEQTLTSAVAFMEVSTGGLPGPLLEAYLAALVGGPVVRDALDARKMVTSVLVTGSGPSVVAWGADCDLVIDQANGQVLQHGPLPRVPMAYRLPHGWLSTLARPGLLDAQKQQQRWLMAAAVVSGLCEGAIQLTSDYVRQREQFGRPIAAFQAVQLPIAEAFTFARAMRMTTLDAAWRSSIGDPIAPVASALAWLAVANLSRQIVDVCHQCFGAAGFSDEIGLTALTRHILWTRLSIGTAAAQRNIASARRQGRGLPSALIHDGFIDPSGHRPKNASEAR